MITIQINTKPNILKRSLATIVDYTVLFVLLYFFSRLFGESNPKGGYTVKGPIVFVILLLWPIYILTIERIYGATFGHKLFNLKVVSTISSKLKTFQVVKRRLCDPIDIFWILGFFAYLLVKNTKYNQRLGDIWAKTIVIDKNDPEQNISFKPQ